MRRSRSELPGIPVSAAACVIVSNFCAARAGRPARALCSRSIAIAIVLTN